MRKSIVTLPQDLFFSLVRYLNLDEELAFKKIFLFVPEYSFTCLKIPYEKYDKQVSLPYSNWVLDERERSNHSISDFAEKNKNRKKEVLYPYLLFGVTKGSICCSLRVNSKKNLYDEDLPIEIATVTGGRLTKGDFIAPELVYVEKNFDKELNEIVRYFRSVYVDLLQSGIYHTEITSCIKLDSKKLFDNTESKQQVIKALFH